MFIGKGNDSQSGCKNPFSVLFRYVCIHASMI
jgi:hypothetical protein